MIPIQAVKYTLVSAVLVLSFLVGLRMIIAHPVQRETWRESVKHYIYFSRDRFRRTTIGLGWVLLIFGLVVANFTILDLIN